MAALSAPQAIGDPVRAAALLLPPGLRYGDGPNDFQINKTVRSASPV